MANRIVQTYRRERKERGLEGFPQYYYEDVPDTKGEFIQYGTDFEEFEGGGGGTFSTALVELSDGTVKNICVRLIKFLDMEEPEHGE